MKDSDPDFLILSWKLNCSTAFEITRDEWMNGMIAMNVDGLKTLRRVLDEIKKVILKEDDMFKDLFFFLFKFFAGDKKTLDAHTCIGVWEYIKF